ncbi:MAG TPA: GDP-mannose 4,6-dehydratase, partial [Patescibacteria group bacterium]|nr:GDP-mannose 4,6-dehydratase [Patescibacteria group bacterium]
MKILVTGGAGFIGSNFIRYKLGSDSSAKIINLDKLTYAGNSDNLKGFEDNENYKFIKGDIIDEKIVSQIMENEKPDALINFAAESHVDNSIKNSLNFTKTNVLGTNVLLNVSKFYNIDRFIQISTDEVYGSTKKAKFSEKDPLKPNNPYSASKTAADVLVRSYIKTYNFPALITRSCNNVGPYQHVEKFIPLFSTNLFQEKKVPLYGDGSNIRE